MGPAKASKLLFVGGSLALDVHTSFISSFPPSSAQKWTFFAFFLDILTIHNDEISYVKHVLDPLYALFRPLVAHLHVVRLF